MVGTQTSPTAGPKEVTSNVNFDSNLNANINRNANANRNNSDLNANM